MPVDVVAIHCAGGNGGNTWGTGISAVRATLTIYSSTIAGNTGTAGTEGSGGSGGFASFGPSGAPGVDGTAGMTTGGGIYAAGATVTLESTIVADNASANGPQAGGSLTANASLFESDAGVTILNPGLPNVLNVDPGLAPLALNGGTTRNHAIATTSAAAGTAAPATARPISDRSRCRPAQAQAAPARMTIRTKAAAPAIPAVAARCCSAPCWARCCLHCGAHGGASRAEAAARCLGASAQGPRAQGRYRVIAYRGRWLRPRPGPLVHRRTCETERPCRCET